MLNVKCDSYLYPDTNRWVSARLMQGAAAAYHEIVQETLKTLFFKLHWSYFLWYTIYLCNNNVHISIGSHMFWTILYFWQWNRYLTGILHWYLLTAKLLHGSKHQPKHTKNLYINAIYSFLNISIQLGSISNISSIISDHKSSSISKLHKYYKSFKIEKIVNYR